MVSNMVSTLTLFLTVTSMGKHVGVALNVITISYPLSMSVGVVIGKYARTNEIKERYTQT